MATVYKKTGGRTVELLIPFEHLGKQYAEITIKPVMFDHTLRWQQGEFRSSLALLAALVGEPESTLRMLRYPDVERVMSCMFDMLPENIRADISTGQIPMPVAPPAAIAPVQAATPVPEEPIQDLGDIAAE